MLVVDTASAEKTVGLASGVDDGNERLKVLRPAKNMGPAAACKQEAHRRVTDMTNRTIFHENWWLDIVTGGKWGNVEIVKGGKLVASLPYWCDSKLAETYCGIPPISRVLSPLLSCDARKTESINRSKAALVGEIIAKLPQADETRFVLGPRDHDALAWQINGFATRIQYTYIIQTDNYDPKKDLRDTTRRVIRRAQETLKIEEMSPERFTSFYSANIGGARNSYFDLALLTPLQHECAKRGQGAAFAAVDAQGNAHSAIFFVWDSLDCYYFLPSRDHGSAHVGATAMLVLHGIELAKSKGLRFDFDGITSEERARFMVNFGGEVEHRTIVERVSRRARALQILKPILTGQYRRSQMHLR